MQDASIVRPGAGHSLIAVKRGLTKGDLMGVHSRGKDRYRVAVIRVSGNWRPRHWDDLPRAGRVVSVSDSPCTRAYAEGCVHQFNTESLERGRHEWAVILDPGSACAPGDRCERLSALFGVR